VQTCVCVCVIHERAHLWLQFRLSPEGGVVLQKLRYLRFALLSEVFNNEALQYMSDMIALHVL